MTTKDEVLRLALEALGTSRIMAVDEAGNYTREVTPKVITEAITACREALAQPAGEPVAEVDRTAAGMIAWRGIPSLKDGTKLYTELKTAMEKPCKYGQQPSTCTTSPMDCQCVLDAALSDEQPAGERGELLQALNELIKKFNAGWHDGIQIDATDIATLCEIEALLSSDAQPSEWVGLTEDEANALWESTDSDWELMKRTEKFLREKNARKDMPAAADKAGGDEPVATGTWEHLKLMMEESAWDGKIELADALANIVDFEKYYTRPQPQAVPAGYALVPVEPTHDQTEAAGCKPGMERTEFVRIYKAMINAAQMKGESE